MIRADVRPDAAVDHGEVVRQKGVVERNLDRKSRRPGRLTAEAHPAVAQATLIEEILIIR